MWQESEDLGYPGRHCPIPGKFIDCGPVLTVMDIYKASIADWVIRQGGGVLDSRVASYGLDGRSWHVKVLDAREGSPRIVTVATSR
jgi:hypothetical protein